MADCYVAWWYWFTPVKENILIKSGEFVKCNTTREQYSIDQQVLKFSLKYCVSQKERVQENQRPYLKMRSPYLQFYFWLNMSSMLGSLCKKIFWHQSNSFEDVALNVDTNKNQNLELLLGAADFHFCLGTHNVPLLCMCVHQQVLQKSTLLLIKTVI